MRHSVLLLTALPRNTHVTGMQPIRKAPLGAIVCYNSLKKKLHVQNALWSHLICCLKAEKMTPFPRQPRQRRKVNSIQEQEIVPIYCACRLPEYGKMVLCDSCNVWYHRECAQVHKTHYNIITLLTSGPEGPFMGGTRSVMSGELLCITTYNDHK